MYDCYNAIELSFVTGCYKNFFSKQIYQNIAFVFKIYNIYYRHFKSIFFISTLQKIRNATYRNELSTYNHFKAAWDFLQRVGEFNLSNVACRTTYLK